ncbi:MAG TPA: hypothetical protein VF312_10760 [Propionibacteriaceae bacterium]
MSTTMSDNTTTTKTKTCPTWCDWQHHGNALEDPAAIGHSHTVLGQATGDDFACVALEQVGDQPVRIFLEVPDDMTVSLEEAVKVAAAITEAVRLAGVTRWPPPPRPRLSPPGVSE